MAEGFSIAIPVIVGVFLGVKLDQWLGTAPIFTVVLMMLGMVSGIYGMIRRQNNMKKK